jgi:hypothetical protein
MDRSDRTTPLHLQTMPELPRGRPLTLVLVSVLSIANAGVFAASVAWPFRHRADVVPTTAIQKARVITLSRRLKGDRLAEPSITREWREQPGGRQDKDQGLPQTPQPQILLPPGPSLPRDDGDDCEPLVNARAATPGSLAELCTAAIETYRKVAAVPHHGDPAGIIARKTQWRGKYV